jgi:hypothetical protein
MDKLLSRKSCRSETINILAALFMDMQDACNTLNQIPQRHLTDVTICWHFIFIYAVSSCRCGCGH